MSKNIKTFLKHATKDYYNQSVNPAVVRASTLIFKSIEDIRKTQNKYKKIQSVVILLTEEMVLQQLLLCSKS